jgi:hypothetical protein
MEDACSPKLMKRNMCIGLGWLVLAMAIGAGSAGWLAASRSAAIVSGLHRRCDRLGRAVGDAQQSLSELVVDVMALWDGLDDNRPSISGFEVFYDRVKPNLAVANEVFARADRTALPSPNPLKWVTYSERVETSDREEWEANMSVATNSTVKIVDSAPADDPIVFFPPITDDFSLVRVRIATEVSEKTSYLRYYENIRTTSSPHLQVAMDCSLHCNCTSFYYKSIPFLLVPYMLSPVLGGGGKRQSYLVYAPRSRNYTDQEQFLATLSGMIVVGIELNALFALGLAGGG